MLIDAEADADADQELHASERTVVPQKVICTSAMRLISFTISALGLGLQLWESWETNEASETG